MTARRDPDRETAFIESAIDPPADYVERVQARLDLGNRLYGDRWAVTPLDDLLAKLIEEALDLTCWAVLTEQRLDTMNLDPSDRDHRIDGPKITIRAGVLAYRALVTAAGKGADDVAG